ncbi:MAG: ABC transporter permease [Oscillospiraceae bacterium]|nr:ABC transporter permease [Oscillospiraceae bacterium]
MSNIDSSASSVGSAVAASDHIASPAGNHWVEGLRRLGKNKVATICFFVFIIIFLACMFAPVITKWDYTTINKDFQLEPPSLNHLLGTDNLGRDVFSRLLYGGRITLRIAVTTAILAAALGCAIGLPAGYFGGRLDALVSPVLDLIGSIPVILLVIVTEFALGWGRGNFMYAMVIAAIPQFARLIRASVMNIIGREYIEAARALGVSHKMIMLRHIMHNIAPALIVRFTTGVAEALLTCTIMGYLGIGINPPTPEWGYIVFSTKSYIRRAPHLVVIPCVLIAVTVISLSLFGDGLRDALDPRDGRV